MHPVIHPVTINYSLSIRKVMEENQKLDIPNLTIDQLKGIAIGKIFVIFEEQRNYFYLETGLIDYLLQFKRVYTELNAGIKYTSTVSCDYFYNQLEYRLDTNQSTLTIIEGNGGFFCISIDFQEFMKALREFITSTAEELRLLYPDLEKNPHFEEHFPRPDKIQEQEIE